MTNYPSSLDDLTDPSGVATLAAGLHSQRHKDVNDAIEALEAKVGVNSSAVTSTLDYKVTNNLGKPLALSGATQATRYVGARATAVPTANTWALGDFMILQSGAVAVCTVAGTPGTWVTIGPGTASMTLADYIIYKSGSNYIARNTATNTDDYTSTNAASVVQSAHDALGKAGLIELKSGITYAATSMVTLSTAGVMVRSRPQAGEDQSTLWSVNSSLSAGQAAFRLTGSGASIGGLSVEINGNADYGIDLRGGGQNAFDLNTQEANVANFYVNGPSGAARCTFWNIRSNNPTANAGINFKLDGPDHVGWGLRATGTAVNGYALWMDTSRCQLSAGHITGTETAAGCVFISGEENRLSDFYFDTGPSGTNGNAHTTIKGSGNYISALVQNAGTKTAVNVSGTASVSGTTYRFTTSTSHGYAAGDAVWLEGFTSSNGFFNGTTTGNVLVTNVSDSTHFDADLGASTTFTDSVGTAKAICKYGVLLQKESAGAYVQGNELHINFQGKGANANNGEFYYAFGFLDESGNDATNFGRFAGNRIYANGANTTRFSNLESTWGTITSVDKISVDAWQYQQDLTTPVTWRTRATGLTAASTASSWTVTHGLAGTPSFVAITPAATLTNQVTWVSGVTATQFTINASASVTNGKFYWKAEM